MKMKLLVVLLVLPMALAGDFAQMWADVEKELQTKGWGSDPKKEAPAAESEKQVTEQKNGSGEEPKGWGEKPKGWGEEPKGGGEEPKGWGEEPKGWGERPKGWGKDSKGWGEEHNGWGEKKEEETEMNENKTMSLYNEFKSWMAKQEKSKTEEEEHKEYLKNNLEKFKEYMKMKQYKEMEEESTKDAIKKEMEKVQMKKLLSEKLNNVSNEYMMQKMKFTEGITTHFLEFCQCGSYKDVFDRITKGQFGESEISGDMSWDYNSEYSMEDESNKNGSSPAYNGTSGGNNNSTSTPKDDDMKNELQTTVKWFAKLSKKEQVKYVLGDLVKVMCMSASNYLGKMKQVEAGLIEYKKKYSKE